MTQTNTAIQNLLVIDRQVTDWQSLAAGAGADTALLILDSGSDGLTQLSDYLSKACTQGLPLLQSIQIISHGSAGSLQLGSSTIRVFWAKILSISTPVLKLAKVRLVIQFLTSLTIKATGLTFQVLTQTAKRQVIKLSHT